MADSADTTAERTRCRELFAKIMLNPTRNNITAFGKALRNGTASADFTPPDASKGNGMGGA